jgi:FKBP-type peptidyl-prolyl cis-trans isomerase FkpA
LSSKKINMKYPLLALVVTLFLACDNNSNGNRSVDYKIQNEQEITTYINEKNLTAQKSDSGLYYVINEEGTGDQPSSNSNVTVAYKGSFINGSVFDESNSDGISFNLQQVIKGWTEGITYFKEGGSGVLLVPAHLGYGNNDTRGIPGGSVLIFEIKLISVN